MRNLLCALLFFFASAGIGRAATYTATTCSQANVNAIINGPTHTAVNGDIIQIPAGNCTWTSGIAVSSIGITIQGAGTPNSLPSQTGAATPATIIQDNISSGQLFTLSPTFGNSLMRLSMMEIEPASGANPASPIQWSGTCASGGCPSIRMDNITFPASWAGTSGLSAASMVLYNDVIGVVDHNSETGNDSLQYIAFANMNDASWLGVGDYGDNSWATADTLGTANTLYLENNLLTSNVGASDCDTGGTGGCRFVTRFNSIVDMPGIGGSGNHGTETSQRFRGGRQAEIYNNSFQCTNNSSGCQWLYIARSGVTYMFANTLSQTGGSWTNEYLFLATYRTFAGFTPWGYCAGQGGYDANDGTTYASGTLTAAVNSSGTLTLTDSSKSWTANQWVNNGDPYSVVDTSVQSSGYNVGFEITASTSNSLTASNYGQDVWNTTSLNAGDSYEILRSSVCIDQPSRGPGTLLSGSTPTPTGSVAEPLDPSYEFADGGYGPGYGGAGEPVQTDTAKLIMDRDYYAEVSINAQTSATVPFNGTTGTGFGTLALRPTSCTAGVGYWATDQGSWNSSGSGGQGVLYKCTATGTPGTWAAAYTPYAYPHPLVSGVTLTGTTTTLTAASTSLAAGSSDLLTATVASSSATGTVTFFDGGSSIGTGTLSSGVATFTATGIIAGTHSYTAIYSGDATYASSTSSSVSVTASGIAIPTSLVGRAMQ
jgi:hypothetical protein